jgi:hypothetical protein
MLDVVPESLVGSRRGECAGMSPTSRRERESVVHEAHGARGSGPIFDALVCEDVEVGDLIEMGVTVRRVGVVTQSNNANGQIKFRMVSHYQATILLSQHMREMIGAGQLRLEALALSSVDFDEATLRDGMTLTQTAAAMIEASKSEVAVSIAEAARVFPDFDVSSASGDALRRHAKLMGVPTYANGQRDVEDVATLTARAIEAARSGQHVRVMTADGRTHEGKVEWDYNPNTSLPIYMLDQADVGWMGLTSGVEAKMRIVSLDEVPAYKNIVEIGQRVSARACVSREQPKSVEWIEVTTLEQAKALDGKLVQIDASGMTDPRSFVTGQRVRAKMNDVGFLIVDTQRPDKVWSIVWAPHFASDGLRLRVVEERPSSVRRDWLYDIGEKVNVTTREDVERLQKYTVQCQERVSRKAFTGRVHAAEMVMGHPEMVITSIDYKPLHMRLPVEIHVVAMPGDDSWLRPNVEQSRSIRACCVTTRVGDVLRLEDESDVRAVMGCEVTWSDRNESGTVSGTVRLLGDVRVRLAEGSQTLCLPVTVRVVKTAVQVEPVRNGDVITDAKLLVGDLVCLKNQADVESVIGCDVVAASAMNDPGAYVLTVEGFESERVNTSTISGSQVEFSVRLSHGKKWTLPISVRIESLPKARACRDCERCCFTGVLVGFTSPDRPCGCVPVKSEGPSEWEVVERGVVQYDNSFTIVVQKSTARASFMIYPTTNGTMVFDASSRQIKQVGVNREYAPEMALARLLCALRDGSVKP